jgi:hypothetical protein
MKRKLFLNVQKEFCGECSLALMHFVGKTKGVDSVGVEDGQVVINFDDSKIAEGELADLARQSIETMGYRLETE